MAAIRLTRSPTAPLGFRLPMTRLNLTCLNPANLNLANLNLASASLVQTRARLRLRWRGVPAALVLAGCGHVVKLDEAQFGPSAFVVECHDEAQCAARVAETCPRGHEDLRPGVVALGAVAAADAPTEAFLREPARAVTGLEVPAPRRKYVRCLGEDG